MSYFRVKDLADRFGVTEHCILAWIRAGTLQATNIARHEGSKRPRWRISELALELFELRRQATPRPQRGRPRKRQPAEVIEFYT
jgi:hypothetical protein